MNTNTGRFLTLSFAIIFLFSPIFYQNFSRIKNNENLAVDLSSFPEADFMSQFDTKEIFDINKDGYNEYAVLMRWKKNFLESSYTMIIVSGFDGQVIRATRAGPEISPNERYYIEFSKDVSSSIFKVLQKNFDSSCFDKLKHIDYNLNVIKEGRINCS